MMFGQYLNSHRMSKRLAKALIRLGVCAGWSEPLLVAHTQSYVAAHMYKLMIKENNHNFTLKNLLRSIFDTFLSQERIIL